MNERSFAERVATGILRRIANPVNRSMSMLEGKQIYDLERRKEELEITKLEHALGKLENSTRERIRHYSIERLGSERYRKELIYYTLIAGEFREGWIPNSYCWDIVAPFASGHLRTLSWMKSVTRSILPDAPLRDIGYFANGVFCDENRSAVTIERFQKEVLSHHSRIIFKADGVGQGEAIHVFDREQFDPEPVRNYGSGVFQRFLDQHELLAAISPGPVATIRIYTCLRVDGTASVRGGYLRVGTKDQKYISASKTIRCPIDLNRGHLIGRGYGGDWTPHQTHPDTGVTFDGYSIPEVSTATEMAIALHRSFPFVRLIGWDFAVEKDGQLALLEWNIRPSIAFVEASCGPNFADLGWETYWRDAKAG